MTYWLALLMLLAAIVHVAEEALTGWIPWAQSFVPGVTRLQFWTMNALFLMICAAACLTTGGFLTLTVASLLFINAWVHIGPTIVQRRRSPGVLSAVLLYLPLSALTFHRAWRVGEITRLTAVRAFLLGLSLMAVPFAFQALRHRLSQRITIDHN